MSKFDNLVIEYWPYILTGIACIVLAKIVLSATWNEERSGEKAKQRKISHSEKTPDEGNPPFPFSKNFWR